MERSEHGGSKLSARNEKDGRKEDGSEEEAGSQATGSEESYGQTSGCESGDSETRAREARQ